MRKYLFILTIVLLLSVTTIPVFSEDNAEDFQPITVGMTLNFVQIVEHIVQRDKAWQVKVVKESFPESLTYTWTKQERNGVGSGTRILTDLIYSRDFNPLYRNNESKATDDTAPWISTDVLKELREKGVSSKFREGGAGAINWATIDLVVKEKVIYPLTINGKAVAIHAFKLNKGMTVWNNLKNPLIIEYEPLGIPLFTSISGWKLNSIDY